MFHENYEPASDPDPSQTTRHPALGTKGEGHILIPLAIRGGELPVVILGLQIAAATKARVMLFHVAPLSKCRPPSSEFSTSWHWLDAIDRLNRASLARGELQAIEHFRERLEAYFKTEVPESIQALAEVQMEVRVGDVAEEIVRFATESSVDLVILSSELSRWRLPILPPRTYRMLQQMHKRVIVVRLESERHLPFRDVKNWER